MHSYLRGLRALILLAASCVAAAAQSATGTIEGRVLNSTDGNDLNNARITTAEAFTNVFGLEGSF
jgi:hypothetical protein